MKLLACDQPQKIVESLTNYAMKPEGFLLLAGTNGTGKTFASQAILNAFDRPNWIEHKYFTTQA